MKILEAGAHGFVLKSDASEEMLDAIRLVYRGHTYISRAVASELAMHTAQRDKHGVDALSKREFELLRNIGAGHSLQECAEKMHLSRSAVSTYRSRLLVKLSLESTAALIRFAIENDIVA
ncbi:response regulator transcription factor [Myxococcota bacterium]|nr:response regulator transcription factor [Myxococcota bacterium]